MLLDQLNRARGSQNRRFRSESHSPGEPEPGPHFTPGRPVGPDRPLFRRITVSGGPANFGCPGGAAAGRGDRAQGGFSGAVLAVCDPPPASFSSPVRAPKSRLRPVPAWSRTFRPSRERGSIGRTGDGREPAPGVQGIRGHRPRPVPGTPDRSEPAPVRRRDKGLGEGGGYTFRGPGDLARPAGRPNLSPLFND